LTLKHGGLSDETLQRNQKDLFTAAWYLFAMSLLLLLLL
jgi:hypothetical protein